MNFLRKLFTGDVDKKVEHTLEHEMSKPLEQTAKSAKRLVKTLEENHVTIFISKVVGSK